MVPVLVVLVVLVVPVPEVPEEEVLEELAVESEALANLPRWCQIRLRPAIRLA